MIENLHSFMSEHGDLDCYYAVDDERNDFHEVYYEPNLYYMNKYRDIEYEEEDVEDFEKICVVN